MSFLKSNTQSKTLLLMFLFIVSFPLEVVCQNDQNGKVEISGKFREFGAPNSAPIQQVRDDRGRLCAMLVVKFDFEKALFEMDSTKILVSRLGFKKREDFEKETKVWLSPDEDYIELRNQGEVLYRHELNNKLKSLKSYELLLTIEFANLKIDAPGGTELYIDGVLRGDGKNGQIPLIKGKHLIEVKKEAFIPFSEEIEILDGQDMLLNVDLKRDRSYKVKKSFFVTYTGSLGVSPDLLANLTSPLTSGISVGQIGRVGWYVTARTTFGVDPADRVYDGAGSGPVFEEPLYFRFNGKEDIRRLSLTGGLTLKIWTGTYLYVGAGYGVKDLLWEIDTYSYQDDSKIESLSLKNDTFSYSGPEGEAGLMFKLKYLLLTAGASSVNLNYTNWTFGVGLNF